MEDKHIFSKSYSERKEKLLDAMRREEIAEMNSKAPFVFRAPVKVLASVAILSVLTFSVYATVQWIDFQMEQNGDEIRVHAGLNETDGHRDDRDDEPLRSWNPDLDEISVRLNIPDLPSDMRERENTNGKYYSEDSSRAITVNGIDLRRSDLDQTVAGANEAKKLDAAGRPLYIITSNSEANFYNRTAFVLLEKEELVLKFWVSYGITDEELLAMASTLTVEETDGELLALPIINEVDGSTDTDIPPVYLKEEAPLFEADLAGLGEAVRDENGWYTASVNEVEIYDNVNALNSEHILQKDLIERFTDDSGNFIPYDRTEVIWSADEGENVTKHFGETVPAKKKLYVVTLTMSDVTMDDMNESDRAEMLEACVNGFDLNPYTVENGEIKIESSSAVVDRKPEVYAVSSHVIYREYLGDDMWRVAYLIDEDTAEGELVLNNYTGSIYFKIQ